MRDVLRRLVAWLAPWYDHAEAQRREGRSAIRDIRADQVIDRAQATRAAYRQMQDRVGR